MSNGLGPTKDACRVAHDLAQRLAHIFLRDQNGNRALFGSNKLFNEDPHWCDLIPFHEYFHGDTGRGCGASHQTGWTGVIAQILIDRGDLAGGKPLLAADESL
jgi:hypothetical protein